MQWVQLVAPHGGSAASRAALYRAAVSASRPANAPSSFCATTSIEAREGVTTGISAADRAATFRALADPASKASDFNRPGHVFPLRPRPGGVLERDGHTEATMDFMRLAGLRPCGILCEVVKDDGSMARVPDLIPFCKQHGLVLTSIADLTAYIKEQRASS